MVAEACNFVKKETQEQAFFCEFCEIFKNPFFIERLRRTASLLSYQERSMKNVDRSRLTKLLSEITA